MIFQFTWGKVLSGEKTQTRRLYKEGDINDVELLSEGAFTAPPGVIHCVFNSNYRVKWQVGKTYAIQPGRGQKGIGRIRIMAISTEDVRNISDEDVKAEGFANRNTFLATWCKMHDKTASIMADYLIGKVDLSERPGECYQAWVLTFELVEAY